MTTASRLTAISWSTCFRPWKISRWSFVPSWSKRLTPRVPPAPREWEKRRCRRWHRPSATRLPMRWVVFASETCRSSRTRSSRYSTRQPRSEVKLKITISTTINGQPQEVTVKPNQTLLEFLRDDLALKGSVEGCGVGVCGSCTVLVDGRPVSSCLMLATNAEGRNIITIEGLSRDGELDPVQQAFLKHQAFQCGYCTPGMIMAVKGLLASYPHPTEEQTRDYLSGNLCRCGTYTEVLAAVKELARE